jgi:hypothetical protein
MKAAHNFRIFGSVRSDAPYEDSSSNNGTRAVASVSARPGRSPFINRFLTKNTVVAALGGMLFGFDTAVIAGTTSALSKTYNLSPGLLGLTVAVALWARLPVLAAIYQQSGKSDVAIKLYARVLQLNPADADARLPCIP